MFLHEHFIRKHIRSIKLLTSSLSSLDNGKKKSVLVDPESGGEEQGHFALYEVKDRLH